MHGEISYRYNIIKIQNLDTFFNVRGGFRNGVRDVYFIRALGGKADTGADILKNDRKMDQAAAAGQLFYRRISQLPRITDQADIGFYQKAYENWKKSGKAELKTKPADRLFGDVLSAATEKTAGQYRSAHENTTETMVKNYVIKLWFWTDTLLKDAIPGWSEHASVKVVGANVMTLQEYLFFYFLTLLGCDVLLLNEKEDVKAPERILALSEPLRLGAFGGWEIPEYTPVRPAPPARERKADIKNVPQAPAVLERSSIKIPERAPRQKPVEQMPQRPSGRERERSFEELALLASSIVLIYVLDAAGEPAATGSGIMIGEKGFILTNCHVVQAGTHYAVRIEDDDQVYATDEIIKYNPKLDLAVIRIQRRLAPIPIYDGRKKLVRGQKVVAIGSPLGLFNSVSDGIISGFRTINDVSMIQFTAPISHGSSGGAVLNLCGEVIGISTAGIDSGQNLNLAVGFEDIRVFAKGFY